MILPMSITPFLRNFQFQFLNEKSEKYKETQKVIKIIF